MQVVLNRGSSTDEEMEQEDTPTLRRSRRRLNSSSSTGESGEEGESRRQREPAHRRRNRQRAKQQSGQSASSPEPIAEEELEGLQMESGMEKSMIEELLRKYGFGSWTKPEEVWKGRQIGHYSSSSSEYLLASTRMANDI